MSNKTILQSHNVRIQNLINAANSLPEVGDIIEDLEAELAAQETLIANITTALQNKAAGGSGGGSIPTCTVTAIVKASFPGSVAVGFLELDSDGYIRPGDENTLMGGWGEDDITIFEDVVQKSTFYDGDGVITSVESEDGSSHYNQGILYIGTSDTTITIGG